MPSPSKPAPEARRRGGFAFQPLAGTLTLAALTATSPPALAQATDALPEPPPPRTKATITADLVYGRRTGLASTLDWIRPDQANGLGVVCIAGVGWRCPWTDPGELLDHSSATHGPIATLVERGFSVFLIRHSDSPPFSTEDILRDVASALIFLQNDATRFEIDPGRLGIVGRDTGATLAILAAVLEPDEWPSGADRLTPTHRIAAAVAVTPQMRSPDAGSLTEMLLRRVTPDDAPLLLVHGAEDTEIPATDTLALKKAFDDANAPCRLLLWPDIGHTFPPGQWKHTSDTTAAWLQSRLNP